MKSSPWYKAQYPYKALGSKLTLQVPHDVFSTLRIDEGTLLFLDHLTSDFVTPSKETLRPQVLSHEISAIHKALSTKGIAWIIGLDK